MRRYIADAPTTIAKKVLPGAARAGGKVIAHEANDRCISSEVRGAIKVTVKTEPGRVIARIQVKGPGSYIAPWLEYGTAPHLISVNDADRQGITVRRINKLQAAGTLIIGGKPVGKVVHHPGARAHPFLRPGLDVKASEAVAAARGYITTRITRAGIVGPDDEGDQA